MKPAIRVEHLSKRYPIGSADHTDSFREAMMNALRRSLGALRPGAGPGARQGTGPRYHQALDDVSFEIDHGDAVGILGRNGAGKSTLLKILSRITEPGAGRAEIHGRMGSLLEVGTGFHAELTGRDNIFLNGTILGMSRREIASRFDEIVEFAEIGEFLDTPVKRYSSGMFVRLAFAVAAHLSPEILLVDEVLAVGDVGFQRKCLGKMNDLAARGRTILFVSHNMAAIRGLTQRSLYLVKGRLVDHDTTARIIDRYLEDAWQNAGSSGVADLSDYRRECNAASPVAIESIAISARHGGTCPQLTIGEDFTVRIGIRARRAAPQAFVAFCLTNALGERVVTISGLDRGWEPPFAAGAQIFRCDVSGLPMSPGRYTVSTWISPGPNGLLYDAIIDYPAFEVVVPEVDSGEVDRSGRPWGAIHWERVEWSVEVGS